MGNLLKISLSCYLQLKHSIEHNIQTGLMHVLLVKHEQFKGLECYRVILLCLFLLHQKTISPVDKNIVTIQSG